MAASSVQSLGRFMLQETAQSGQCPAIVIGDSHGIGNDNGGGLSMPIQLLCQALGAYPHMVGKLAMNESADRFVHDSLGGQKSHHCVSGITTAQLVAGGTGTLNALTTDLVTYAPKVSFLSVMGNDSAGGTVDIYRSLLDAFSAYQPFHKVVWFTAPDSNSTSVSYYTPDTNRTTGRANIREAVRRYKKDLQVHIVDAVAAMGPYSRYPDTDPTTDNLNANGLFYDTAHLRTEGYAIIAAAGIGPAFGLTQNEALRLLCKLQLYAPVDWGYPGTDGNITAAAAETYLVASSGRKNVMTNFEVYNPHATTTAVVTLSKRRVPLADLGETNPASDNGTSTAFRVFKVAPGTRDGWSLPLTSAPIAWINEGWTVSCTGADVNVTAMGKKVLHVFD